MQWSFRNHSGKPLDARERTRSASGNGNLSEAKSQPAGRPWLNRR